MISPEEGIIENIVYFKEDYMIKNLFLREDNKFVKKFGIQKVKSAIQEIQKLDMSGNKELKPINDLLESNIYNESERQILMEKIQLESNNIFNLKTKIGRKNLKNSFCEFKNNIYSYWSFENYLSVNGKNFYIKELIKLKLIKDNKEIYIKGILREISKKYIKINDNIVSIDNILSIDKIDNKIKVYLILKDYDFHKYNELQLGMFNNIISDRQYIIFTSTIVLIAMIWYFFNPIKYTSIPLSFDIILSIIIIIGALILSFFKIKNYPIDIFILKKFNIIK